jgi:hypothetical protein
MSRNSGLFTDCKTSLQQCASNGSGYKDLAVKSEGMKTRHRWEYNIKAHIKEMGRESEDWLYLA